MKGSQATALGAALLLTGANAQYKIDTREEIIDSARDLAHDLMLFYNGNETGQTPGILPGPPTENKGDYYWWEGGAMMGTYIDYWHYTRDATYNKVVMQGMLHQVGDDRDYQPVNHTLSLGNDDQGFWGMSAMLAAEVKFPNPPDDQPQWLALAQAVWTTQADPERHDDECNGGMRWQIPPTNANYDYKNTIANGCFFNLGARLARYTGNETYAKRAEETWDWLWGVRYIDNKNWRVYDGGHVGENCTDINPVTFSYNAGVLIQGAAFMYNFTEDKKWEDRLNNLLDTALDLFFPDNIAYELPCEHEPHQCSTDMLSFKGYVARWLTQATQLVPGIADKVLPVLRNSAEAAVKQCTGGASGRACGFYWSTGQFVDPTPKTTGAGEAMNVLGAVSALLIDGAAAPVTNKTGGISKGDNEAGTHSRHPGDRVLKPIKTKDKAGAYILTILIVGCATSMFVWMSWGRHDITTPNKRPM